MAVDTSIPLSYKPIEVENPLNRMAVVQGVQANAMKIQEMQRAQEEQNQLRALFSSGADLSSPDVVKQAMRISPELGMKIRTAQLQEQEQQTKIISEKMKLSREMLNGVRTPEEYVLWSKSQHDDPDLGPFLASMGASHEQTIAKVQEALKTPGGFEQLRLESQAGIEKALDYSRMVKKDADEARSRRVHEGIAAGNLAVAQGHLGLARQKEAREAGAATGSDAAKQNLSQTVSDMRAGFNTLLKNGGIKSSMYTQPGANIHAGIASSKAGQIIGGIFGTENQAIRDEIVGLRSQLTGDIMKATGLKATQLNSDIELQNFLRGIGDPSISYETNMRLLNSIENRYGIGNKIAPAGKAPAKPNNDPLGIR